MKKTSLDLLNHRIEQLIREHMAICLTQAQATVARAFAVMPHAHGKASTQTKCKPSIASHRGRKPSAEIKALRQRLYALICAHPGESMRFFADSMGVVPKRIEQPMARLRAERYVDTVGQYQKMRYFPIAEHVELDTVQ